MDQQQINDLHAIARQAAELARLQG
jgi:hypothetical protein